MLSILTTIFSNKRLLGFFTVGIAAFVMLSYIGILKWQVSSLKDDNHELELKNQALLISTENLMNSLNTQNEAVKKLNSKLINTREELSVTIKKLNSELQVQRKTLEAEYKSLPELSDKDAVEWLKNRRY